MKVADYIFAFLRDQGARSVFFVSGGGNMHLVDALARCTGVQAVPMHHEQACAMAAEACSRVSSCPGIALVTSGPGSTNAITGVGEAYTESVPLIVISGQVKRADLKTGSGLRQKGAQEVDIVAIASSLTKSVVTVLDPAEIRFHLERAFRIAREGRPGPVWLDIPLDVQASEIEPEQLKGDEAGLSHPAAFGAEMEQLRDLLRAAERPVVMAGHGVRLSGAVAEFRTFAETLQAPVVTTWNALDLLPYDHPLVVGRPGAVAWRAPNFAVQNADLLIVLGSRLDPSVTAFNPQRFGRSAKRVIVDVDPVELGKLDHPFALKLEVDVQLFLTAAIAAISGGSLPRWDAWRAQCADWKARYGIGERLAAWQSDALSHYEVVDAFSDLFPEGRTIVTGGSGLSVEAFYVAFRNKAGQRVFTTSGLGSMGYGLPAGLGASLAQGGAECLCIESDGSLMMNLQELATLRAHRAPVKLFVINNDGYASIRNTQRNYFDGRFLGTGPESGLYMPSFKRLAEAMELPALSASTREDLRPAIAAALAHEGPVVCEIHTARDEALLPKAMAVPQPDGSMLSMPLEDMTPLLPRAVLRREMLVPLTAESERLEG
ncbi:thiamine pyrophosphate-binding protein [Methylobacterium sp. A54F]